MLEQLLKRGRQLEMVRGHIEARGNYAQMAREHFGLREEYWALLQNSLPLELIKENPTLFSNAVHELKESLLDGILAREGDDAYLERKKALEACQPEEIDSDVRSPADSREGQKENMAALTVSSVRMIAEVLAKHRFHESVQTAFEASRNTTEDPKADLYTILRTDKPEIRQIKKLVNALDHFEKGIQIYTEHVAPHITNQIPFASDDEASTPQTWGAYFTSAFSGVRSAVTAAYYGREILQHGTDALDHFHAGFDALTHVETTLFEAFAPEWQAMTDILDSDVLDESFEALAPLKEAIGNPTHGIAYTLGVLLDQLNPEKTDGVINYSLWIRMLSALGTAMDQKTDALQSLFSEAGISDEARQDSAEIAAELHAAVGKLRGNPLDIIYFALIATKALAFLSDTKDKSTRLQKAGADAFHTKLEPVMTALRDEYLPALIAFVDKIELVTLSEKDSLSKPLIDLFSEFGLLQADALQAKRLAVLSQHAEIQRKLQEDKHIEVQGVLMPCLQLLMLETPNDEQKQQMARAYQILQPHLEAVDAEYSDFVLTQRRLVSPGEATYPVLNVNTHRTQIGLLLLHLSRLKGAHDLSVDMADEWVNHIEKKPINAVLVEDKTEILRERRIAALTSALEGAETTDFNALNFADTRLIDKNLITDVSETSLIKRAARNLDAASAYVRKHTDKNAKETDLSLRHKLPAIFEHCKNALNWAEGLSDTQNKLMFTINGSMLALELKNAAVDAYTYGTDLFSAAEAAKAWMLAPITNHHQLNFPDNSTDLYKAAVSMMYGLSIAPAHFEMLAEGRSALRHKDTEAAVLKAHYFARKVEQLNQHWHLDGIFKRYSLLAAEGVLSSHSPIWELKAAVTTALESLYENMMTHGLDGMNPGLIRKVQNALDTAEAALSLKPGTISIPADEVIDEARSAFLKPLSIPSEKYISLVMDKDSDKARAKAMRHSPSHQHFFNQKKNTKAAHAKKRKAKKDAINRAFDAELIRIEQSEQFELKHKSLYLKHLNRTMRPILHKTLSGEGQFEASITELMYGLPPKPLQDMHALSKDYRRLDDIQKQIEALEHALASDLYENDATRAKKQKWLKRLHHIATANPNSKCLPEARIARMRREMEKPAFKEDMLAFSELDSYFSVQAFKRGVRYLLSLVGLYTWACEREYDKLMEVQDKQTVYSDSPLIHKGLFGVSAEDELPRATRNYTPESAPFAAGLI